MNWVLLNSRSYGNDEKGTISELLDYYEKGISNTHLRHCIKKQGDDNN